MSITWKNSNNKIDVLLCVSLKHSNNSELLQTCLLRANSSEDKTVPNSDVGHIWTSDDL